MPDDCVQRRANSERQCRTSSYDGEDTDDPTDNDLIKITPSSLSDWSLADRGMERRFALREPATGR
jgi:hypothetical protein